MAAEAEEIKNTMVIDDNFRGGDKRRAIAAAEMRENRDIGDGDPG